MTTMHENIMALSTSGQQLRDFFHTLDEREKTRALRAWREQFDDIRDQCDGVRRFVSAEHAVRVYLVIAGGINGEAAIDYERISMHVQTQADPENPYLSGLTDKLALEQAFDHARRRSSERDWKIWVSVRVYQKSASGISRRQAKRTAKQVDALVEQWLKAHHRLVGCAVRQDTLERYDDAA